ncbi:MAG TPA: hypothetical protein VGC36_02830, partial [Rhizomicrobium sp.]
MDPAPQTLHSAAGDIPRASSLPMQSILRTWIGFFAMCLGMSLAVLDIQIVASSFTTIQAYFHVTPERLSWIQTGYLMAEVIAIPLTGWLTR